MATFSGSRFSSGHFAFVWPSCFTCQTLSRTRSISTYLIAIVALGDEAIEDESSLSKASRVVLLGAGPALRKLGAARLVRPLDAHDELLVGLAFEVDDGVGDRYGLLFGDEEGVEVGITEGALEVVQGELRVRHGVSKNAFLDLLDVLVTIRLLQSSPGFLCSELGVDLVSGEEAVGGALGDGVARNERQHSADKQTHLQSSVPSLPHARQVSGPFCGHSA